MSLTIQPISPALGAIVSGIDPAPLDGTGQRAIEQALLEHQVLFFRDQSLEPRSQARFAARFGDLHIHPIYPSVPEQPEVIVLDTAVTDVRDNAIWHTDVTFLETPALGAVLAAKQLPPYGGDTLGEQHGGLRRCRRRCGACWTASRRPTTSASPSPRALRRHRGRPGAPGGGPPEESAALASGGAHPSAHRAQGPVRQRWLHHPHQRTGAGRERCAADVPLRPCHAT